jgi:hypothetical protein
MAQPSASGKCRALVVEDEFLNAVDLEAILHLLGFDVCRLASNPSDAVSLATSNRLDASVWSSASQGMPRHVSP